MSDTDDITYAQIDSDYSLNLEYRTLQKTLYHRFNRLLNKVELRRQGYQFIIGRTFGMKYPYLQLQVYRPDSTTHEMEWGGSGKAYLSEFMSDSEFFQCALGMAIAYEQHEVRELFFVDGVRVYGPHIDWQALASVAGQLDARQQVDLTP